MYRSIPFFVALTACNGADELKVCTAIGCTSVLTITVTDAGNPPVGLNGTVTVGADTFAVDCDGTSDPEVTCDGAVVTISAPGFDWGGDVEWTFHAGDPGATQGGGYTGNGTFTPTWTSDQPNGPDCDPTCWTGEGTVALFGTP